MIRPLRVRHRLIWTGLAVALPALYVLGLAARQPVPGGPIPVPLGDESPAAPAAAWHTREIASGRVLAMAVSPGAGARPAVLWLHQVEDWRRPDILVYWSETPLAPQDDLADAILLGALDGPRPRSLNLPSRRGGHLTLYSLAHRERIGSVALAGVRGEPR